MIATGALVAGPALGWAQTAPPASAAPDAQAIMETMRRKMAQRNAGGDRFFAALHITTAGSSAVLMEKVSDEAGYRIVAPTEIQAWLEEAAGMDPGDRRRILTGLTSGYRTLVGQTSAQVGGVNEEATLRLFDQTVLPFLQAGMVPPDWARAEGEESARQGARDLAEVAGLLSLEALQQTSEGPVWRLAATGLDRRLSPEFTLQEVRLWVDTATHVPLRLRMIGDLRRKGEASRRVTIQKDSWDYAKIGSLYEPARLQLSLTGIFGAKELKKLEEAKGRLDEFKKKLAEMPAAQRAQVERMVGPQMRQLEEMAAGGAVDLPVRILYFRSKGGPTGLDALLAAYAYQAGTMAKALDGDVSPLTLE